MPLLALFGIWIYFRRRATLFRMSDINTLHDVAESAGISDERLREIIDREMDIITADEAAAWLKVSPRWFRDICARGEIPAAKVGREWRISRRRMIAYIESSARD